MVNLKKAFSVLFIALLFISNVVLAADGGGKALIIIDMQPTFVERGGNDHKPENKKKVAEILAIQTKSIEMAKKAGIPIVFLEYEDFGPTNSVLKKAVGDYAKTKYFLKDTDGMFSPRNDYKEELDNYLESEKVKTLIITGANGGACVKSSISGALRENYNVLAFSKGIADFNYRDFIYPYDDKYHFTPKCKDCTFREVDDLHEIGILMESDTSKEEKTTKINDSSRDADLRGKTPAAILQGNTEAATPSTLGK